MVANQDRPPPAGSEHVVDRFQSVPVKLLSPLRQPFTPSGATGRFREPGLDAKR